MVNESGEGKIDMRSEFDNLNNNTYRDSSKHTTRKFPISFRLISQFSISTLYTIVFISNISFAFLTVFVLRTSATDCTARLGSPSGTHQPDSRPSHWLVDDCLERAISEE